MAHVYICRSIFAAVTSLANMQCRLDWTCRPETAASAALWLDDADWFQTLCSSHTAFEIVFYLITSVTVISSPI